MSSPHAAGPRRAKSVKSLRSMWVNVNMVWSSRNLSSQSIVTKYRHKGRCGHTWVWFGGYGAEGGIMKEGQGEREGTHW